MKPATLKICGITSQQAVDACVERGVGFVGFIAVAHSLRYVAPEQYQALAHAVPEGTHKVLVSVDATDDDLDAYVAVSRPTMMQLHGIEPPQRMAWVKERYGIPIIKAYGVSHADEVRSAITQATSVADWLLLDTKHADGSSGGTGMIFDWSILDALTIPLPYFLSGGLDVWNIERATQQTRAQYFDVSSSLEYPKGVKDVGRIHQFIDKYERCVR
jgi:phosphoribosylanthranilate isomerase